MKITIYVRVKDLEKLNKFLQTNVCEGKIKFFHDFDSIIYSTCVMVTLTYDDYVRLVECQK